MMRGCTFFVKCSWTRRRSSCATPRPRWGCFFGGGSFGESSSPSPSSSSFASRASTVSFLTTFDPSNPLGFMERVFQFLAEESEFLLEDSTEKDVAGVVRATKEKMKKKKQKIEEEKQKKIKEESEFLLEDSAEKDVAGVVRATKEKVKKKKQKIEEEKQKKIKEEELKEKKVEEVQMKDMEEETKEKKNDEKSGLRGRNFGYVFEENVANM